MDKPVVESHPLAGRDPFEEIYALNIGDFMAENFISDELLIKISNRLANDPNKLRQQLEELVQIYSMDKTLRIMGFDETDDFIIYDSIAVTLCNMLQVDACHIFQTAHKDASQDYLSLTGTSLQLSGSSHWEIGLQVKEDDLLCQAYRDNKTVISSELTPGNQWHPIERLNQHRTKAFLATPLLQRSMRLGLLVFESYGSADMFGPELAHLSEATAQVFITSLRLQQLISQAQGQLAKEDTQASELQNLRAQITEGIADLGIYQQAFVEALAAAIDSRHQFTQGHSKRVASIARTLAESMQLNEKTIDLVYYGGLLGNLGKIHIPSEVLAKKDSLSKHEWEALQNHPNVGVNLLMQINFLAEVVPYVHSQKERWDGSGGPEGLSGKSIPLGSRILAVADAYHAMTCERPYREKAFSHSEALAELKKEAGTQWDPTVIDALANMSVDSLQ